MVWHCIYRKFAHGVFQSVELPGLVSDRAQGFVFRAVGCRVLGVSKNIQRLCGIAGFCDSNGQGLRTAEVLFPRTL